MQNLETDNLAEARRFLPLSDVSELRDFERRQRRARLRFAKLKTFYAANSCRMARLHLLAAAAVALGRHAAHSEVFDEIGETLMPTGDDDEPRTADWQNFADACRQNLPFEVREELWLAAHFKDFAEVRRRGLEEKFYAEVEAHENDSTRQLLRQHLEAALGARLLDKSAIAGVLPYETAIAGSLATFTKKMLTASFQVLALYTKETARAAFDFSPPPEGLLSYRQTAFDLLHYTATSLTASKIFRRGLRLRERGAVAENVEWNLLEQVLGESVALVNPLIVDFYANPSRFDVTATLKLETMPARFWSRALTLLLGQGLYENNLHEIPARFRTFKRRDGSMHFVRELFCDGKYRVFDADFVVSGGKLYEVFTDFKMRIEMHVSPIENGGLSIKSRRFLFHGRAVPTFGFKVDFQSRVEKDSEGNEILKVDGVLSMNPDTAIGAFVAHKILRRPKNLGSIHYTARRK